MQSIILAGGMGKRLSPLTNDRPKCMVEIERIPLLDFQLKWLKQYGIDDIVVACGHKWEKIKEHYGDRLTYSVEDTPLGTGGAVKHALKHIRGEEFLLVNCDDITDVDINKLIKVGSNSIVVSNFCSQFGIVEVEDGKAKRFLQKPKLPYYAWIGIALLNKTIPLPDAGAIEIETFPKIELKAFTHDGLWKTINTMKDLDNFKNWVRTGNDTND